MNTPSVKKTIIVSAYPCCGKTYAFENNKDYTILDSDSSKFSWIERKRTQEELDEIKRVWESEDHLLSGEGYINKIKDDIIKVRNPHFIDDYLNHIKENIGKVDCIRLFDDKVCNAYYANDRASGGYPYFSSTPIESQVRTFTTP